MKQKKLRLLKNNKRQFGFTIVELIVVISVLGILATVVGFGVNGFMKNAAETGLKVDLANAAAILKQNKQQKEEYPASLPSSVKPTGKGTFTYTVSTDQQSFCLQDVLVGYGETMIYHVTDKIAKPTAGVGPGGSNGICPQDTGGGSTPSTPVAKYEDLVNADSPTLYCTFDETARDASYLYWQEKQISLCGTGLSYGRLSDGSSGTPPKAWDTQQSGAINPANTGLGAKAIRLYTGNGPYDSYGNVSSSSVADSSRSNWTAEIWAKFVSNGQAGALISKDDGWGLRSIGSGFACDYRQTTPSWSVKTISGGTSIVANKWYHIACTRDGALLKLYVDGVLVASASDLGNGNVSGNNMRFGGKQGGDWYGSSPQLDGWIDEFAFYNKTLTLEEIQNRYNTYNSN